MSLIALWLVYLKNKGYLPYANHEHLHNIGIFMFAFFNILDLSMVRSVHAYMVRKYSRRNDLF
jgi:hypothetical protein